MVQVIAAGEWKWREGNRVAPRSLPVTNLVLYHEGRGTIEVGDQQLRIEKPETLVCISRGLHQCAVHDHGYPFRASSIHCKLEPRGGLQDLLATIGVPVALPLNHRKDRLIIDAFSEITRLGAHKPVTWQARGNAHLLLILHHLVGHYGNLLPP